MSKLKTILSIIGTTSVISGGCYYITRNTVENKKPSVEWEVTRYYINYPDETSPSWIDPLSNENSIKRKE